jgi:hypothetical protein
MLTLAFQVFALLYAIVLPGVLLSLAADREWPLPIRLVAGFTLGVLIVPMVCFCVAWLLSTSVSSVLVLGVATVLNGVAALVAWKRGTWKPSLRKRGTP